MAYMKIDGETISEDDAYILIEKMYGSYFAEKHPLKDIDLLAYAGEDFQKLLDDWASFHEIGEDEEDMDIRICEDVTGNTAVTATDGKIDLIRIKGDSGYSPVFGGIAIGDSLYNIDVTILEGKGYSYVPTSEDAGDVLYYVKKILQKVPDLNMMRKDILFQSYGEVIFLRC